MQSLTQDEKMLFVDACRRVAAAGLLRYSSGNMSWRLRDNLMLVSGTGTWLGELTAEQVACCKIDTGEVIGGVKPSVEAGFHRGILQNRPEMNVVLHFQTPYATALCCAEEKPAIDFNLTIEMPFYIGEPGWVPYACPGTEKLASMVIEEMKTHDLVLLQNHGLVAAGKNFLDVTQRAGFFELTCEMLAHNPSARRLPAEDVRTLRDLATRKTNV